MATKDIYSEKMANLSTRYIIVNMYACNNRLKIHEKRYEIIKVGQLEISMPHLQ